MPHARILTALEGHPGGRILVASLEDDPAAGAEINITVPGRAAWEIMAVTFTLVTSSDVAIRTVSVSFDDGQHVFVRVAMPTTQSASLTWTYSLFAGGDRQSILFGLLRQALPADLVMLPGWRITTLTSNLQAADNFGAPVLYIREIPERGEGVWDDLARAVATEIIERRAINV